MIRIQQIKKIFHGLKKKKLVTVRYEEKMIFTFVLVSISLLQLLSLLKKKCMIFLWCPC